MTPPRRPWGAPLRRALLGAVAAVALAVAVVPPTAGAAPPVRTQTAGITFRGISQTHWVERDGTWILELAVEGAPPGAEVTGAVHERLDDRLDYNRALYYGVVDGEYKAGIPSRALDPAPEADGGGREVSLAVTLLSDQASQPGWAFFEEGLRPGVFPVVVTVDSADGDELARTVVFLTRVPTAEEEPGRAELLVTPVLPIAEPPSVDAEGNARLPESAVADVSGLANGLALTEDMPATLVPRPETVEALARDAAPPTEGEADEDEEDQGGEEEDVPDAGAALAALRRAAADRQTVDGAYVDIPVPAWVDRGLLDELDRQRDRGTQILTSQLGEVDRTTWLAEDGLTSAAAEALWQRSVRSVILPVGATEPVLEAPTGPFTVDAAEGRTLQAVEADPGLGRTLVQRQDPVLDEADLAAELALLAAAGDVPGGVVLWPTADWAADADAVTALAAVLQHPLAPVRPVTVEELFATVANRGTRPLRPPTGVDLGSYPERLDAARAALGSYGSLVGPEQQEVVALDQRLLLSAASTLSATERDVYVASVGTTVEARMADVQAPTGVQTVTLTAADGDVPVTLRNQLDSPVRVVIEIDTETRVEVRGSRRIEVDLPPGTKDIYIPIHARAPGESPIDVTVRTPDGAVVLGQVRYTVRSTAISNIGIFLSVGAVVVLVLWWARHWRQARRARHAPDAA